MQYKRLKLGAVLLLGLGLTDLHAQSSVNSTGGNASGSGGSVSYSVGQVFYNISTGTNGSVVPGVQQPYEISTVTAIEEVHGINLLLSAYPNPTSDYLTLEIDASITLSTQSMTYQLFNVQGKLLRSGKITGSQTSINMQDLLPTTYFVKVIDGNKEVKTFKIIKN